MISSTEENNNFKMGLRDGVPIALGYVAVSFAFGLYATGAGLSVIESIMISLFNLTSAGQMAAVPIIAGGGGIIELAVTQLVINIRYSLMSVALSQRFGESVGLRHRFLIAFTNTDEIFALGMAREGKLTAAYFLGAGTVAALGWTGGTLSGYPLMKLGGELEARYGLVPGKKSKFARGKALRNGLLITNVS